MSLDYRIRSDVVVKPEMTLRKNLFRTKKRLLYRLWTYGWGRESLKTSYSLAEVASSNMKDAPNVATCKANYRTKFGSQLSYGID